MLYLLLGASSSLTNSPRAGEEPRTHLPDTGARTSSSRSVTLITLSLDSTTTMTLVQQSCLLLCHMAEGSDGMTPFHSKSSGGLTRQQGKTTAGQTGGSGQGPPSIQNRKQRKSLESQNNKEEIVVTSRTMVVSKLRLKLYPVSFYKEQYHL